MPALAHVKRSTAVALTLALLAGCMGTVSKSSRDDRERDDGIPSGSQVGTPTTSTGPARCTEATAIPTQLQPVYILFVVDGSGSMNEEGKWSAIVPSVGQIVDQVAAKNDRTVGLGVMTFADEKDPTGTGGIYGPYPNAIDIPIRFVDAAQATAMKERLDTTPKGITPTQAALEGGYKLLRSFVPAAPLQPGGRKILVIITDGFPASYIANYTCPTNDGLCTQTQMANALQMAENESRAADPILTFAVGVGSFPGDGVEYDPAFVGRLAVAGGTRKSPSCNPYENANPDNACHFQVTPGMKTVDELREEAFQAINMIRDKTLACDFEIKAPPAGFSVDSRTVSVRRKMTDGNYQTILPNPNDGWSFDNANTPKRVLLNGNACRKYREAGGDVEVVLACK